jgi:hypothetical protein
MISVLTPSIRPEFLNITQECLEQQTFTDFEWLVEVGLRNRGFMLPTDLNKMLARAKGDRIVMLQDCISILPNALERINALPNNMITFPVGQTLKMDEAVEWDWRVDEAGMIPPEAWEADFACAPTEAFFEVGGYDERYNQGWSWDNVEIAYRIRATGRLQYCYPGIRGISLKHDQMRENPFRNKLPNNDKKSQETKYRADRGDFKLDYLQKRT